MTARKLVTNDRIFDVSGEGYATEGSFFAEGSECTVTEDSLLFALLYAAAACNDAELIRQDHRPAVVGDPTEGALLVAAAKGGLTRKRIRSEIARLCTIPIASYR